MYTLRLTRALLGTDRDDPDDEPDVAATTRLGDWHVGPLDVGGRSLLVCASDTTGLTVVLPRPDLTDLPEHLGVALVPVLRALGVPDRAIAAEIDEMATGRVGVSHSVAARAWLRAQARRVARALEAAGAGPVDVAALHASLATRVNGKPGAPTVGELTVARFRQEPA